MDQDDIYTVSDDLSLFDGMKYKKESMSFSIRADIKKDYDAFIKENDLNRSNVIQKVMLNILVKAGVRKKA